VNAIRAHLAGIGRADSPCAAAEHMNQIAQALTRIDSALSKTAEEVPNDADPGGENWKATRNSKAA